MKVTKPIRSDRPSEHLVELLNRREETSLRQKLNDINKAIEPLVSDNCGELRMRLSSWRQDKSFTSLREKEVTIAENEHHTEQAKVEARAHYMDWKKPKTKKLASLLPGTVLRSHPPDYEKVFHEAGEPSEKTVFIESEDLLRWDPHRAYRQAQFSSLIFQRPSLSRI
jgi:hypothetical protein